jgi:hypothetical protein
MVKLFIILFFISNISFCQSDSIDEGRFGVDIIGAPVVRQYYFSPMNQHISRGVGNLFGFKLWRNHINLSYKSLNSIHRIKTSFVLENTNVNIDDSFIHHVDLFAFGVNTDYKKRFTFSLAYLYGIMNYQFESLNKIHRGDQTMGLSLDLDYKLFDFGEGIETRPEKFIVNVKTKFNITFLKKGTYFPSTVNASLINLNLGIVISIAAALPLPHE